MVTGRALKAEFGGSLVHTWLPMVANERFKQKGPRPLPHGKGLEKRGVGSQSLWSGDMNLFVLKIVGLRAEICIP